MSIRNKVLLLLSIVSALFAVTTYAVQRWTIMPGFIEAEDFEARQDLARCVEALARDAEHLSSSSHDWAAWDDMYRYVDDRNEAFATANMIPETFENNHINLLAILTPKGERIWADLRDEETSEPILIPGFWEDLCRPDHPLVKHSSTESFVSGVLMTAQGPMLVGSRPVITSKNEGPIRGALMMGRLIDEQGLAELANRTRVKLTLWPLTNFDLPRGEKAASDRLAVLPNDEALVHPENENVLYGRTLIRDVFGKPALLLRAELPRDISRRGLAAARVATGLSISAGLAVLVTMWLLLSRTILGPLSAVTRHAVRVGTHTDLRTRLDLKQNDEIGILSREFDRMMTSLAESRAKMLETAHRAGMAELAVDMLHNVGNVLNSVNTSSAVVTEKLRKSEIPSVGLAAKLMIDHQADLGRFITEDQRGRQIPGYLLELSGFLVQEQNAMLDEMKRLAASVEHITQIVNTQNSRSKSERVIELEDPAALIEEAVRLNAESFDRHGIRIQREFEPVGCVPLDRHRVLQILTNLISNAKSALQDSDPGDRRITLHVSKSMSEGRDVLRISVSDNGQGIAADNLAKVFAFGFSTRANGNGFGLHSAGNLAREMAGSLVAQSDGPGRGATFVLELPLCSERACS